MGSLLSDDATYYLRHAMLGTEAVYEVLAEDAGIVTAQVVSARGLEPGMRVRLTASAARAMERLDMVREPVVATRSRFASSRRERATAGAR